MRRLLLLVLALAACDSGSKPATSGSGSAQAGWMIDLPRVVRTPAFADMEKTWFLIATQQGIVIDGKTVVPIVNGSVPAEYKEGGAHGLKIERLAKFLEAMPKDGGPLQLALARNLEYPLLVEILFSAKQSGFKSFHFLVTDSHGPLAIPLTLPDKAATATVQAGPIPSPANNGPYSRISVGDSAATTETSLTPQNVLQKIQSAYMAGLKRCYKDALKRDPTLHGNLKLNLTVNETGRTVKAEAKGFDASVDTCISGMMASWRFPIPKDNDGEAVNATFSITLHFIPDDEATAAKAKDAQAAETADHAAATKLADSLRGDEPSKATVQALPGEPHYGSAREPAPVLQDPDRMPLGLVVSVSKDTLLVWSISGLEGTLSSPRLRVPLSDPTSMKQLNALLVDIVKRRWEGKDRPPATNAIIVMADAATTMQTVADVFVAVRATVDGATPLFPDIQLSAGFE